MDWLKIGGLSILLSGAIVGQVRALPGQSAAEVSSWIQANPAFRDTEGSRFRLERNPSAAQKFVFEASKSLPLELPDNTTDRIRSERIYFFDVVHGVTKDQLLESLRTIYGANIYFDFMNASVVESYPNLTTVDESKRSDLPLLAAQQGEFRIGDRYGYWLELVQTDRGMAYNGQLVILRRSDVKTVRDRVMNNQSLNSN